MFPLEAATAIVAGKLYWPRVARILSLQLNGRLEQQRWSEDGYDRACSIEIGPSRNESVGLGGGLSLSPGSRLSMGSSRKRACPRALVPMNALLGK